MLAPRGEKIVDIGPILEIFEAQEGIVEHIIGKTGNGKTYEGTRRAIQDLMHGEVVYTTWKLILPEHFDQRESPSHLLFNFIFGRKNFYKFDLKKNWHYIDIDMDGLIPFIESLTDCKLYMDEGQDVFDSRGGLDKSARKTITRSRHMRKTLVIISQRAQAVDVNARANVSWFYKCVKTRAWFWPFAIYFKIYKTDEMDDQNYPVWEERLPNGEMWKAPIYSSHFADKKIFNAYNSWYLRNGKEKSQQIHVEAYKLTRGEMLSGFFEALFARKTVDRPQKEVSEKLKKISPSARNVRKTLKIAVQYEHETPPEISDHWNKEEQNSGVRHGIQQEETRKRQEETNSVENQKLLMYDIIPPIQGPSAQRHEPEAKKARAKAPRKTIRVKTQSTTSTP